MCLRTIYKDLYRHPSILLRFAPGEGNAPRKRSVGERTLTSASRLSQELESLASGVRHGRRNDSMDSCEP